MDNSETETERQAEHGKAAPAAAADPGEAHAVLSRVWDGAVARWIAGRVHNSPISRSTEAVNHLLTVLPHLRDELLEAVQPHGAAPAAQAPDQPTQPQGAREA